MEHLREWDKLQVEFEATGDTEPIRKESLTLCEKYRTALENYWKVNNAELEKKMPAQITLENTLRQMDEFRKRFFEEK